MELGSDAGEFGNQVGLCSGTFLATHLTRPFRIISSVSIACNVRHAVVNG